MAVFYCQVHVKGLVLRDYILLSESGSVTYF